MDGKKKRERERVEVRAFKSKTPPLLVDTTVLFPPKKVKGEGRGRFRFVFFPCLSIPRSPFTLLLSLSPCLPSVCLDSGLFY